MGKVGAGALELSMNKTAQLEDICPAILRLLCYIYSAGQVSCTTDDT